MNKKLLVLFFIIMTCFLNCKSENVVNNGSNIIADFPTSEKIALQFFKQYDISLDVSECYVGDSVLWVMLIPDDNSDNIGSCFNLNSGEKLSIIANKGRASYEFISVYNVEFIGDSVQFSTDLNVIKSFAKKDIIENKPMDQRRFSSTSPIDTISIDRKIKLLNGSVLATISGAKSSGRMSFSVNTSKEPSEFNKKMIAVIDSNGANSYQPIDFSKLVIQKSGDLKENKINNVLRAMFSASHIGLKGNDMAVFATGRQLILYTFDLNRREILNQKIYSTPIIEKVKNSPVEMLDDRNDLSLCIQDMKCTDEYIVCVVRGYLSKEEKESKTLKNSVLVFDWNLNPVKRFDFEAKHINNHFLSEDCHLLYSWEEKNEGLVLNRCGMKF